jgi:hypothetical protein
MELLPMILVVYGGIVLYDMLAGGKTPVAALFWPFQSAGKILAWIGKQDPAVASQLTLMQQQLAALQQQLEQALQNKINPPAPTPTPVTPAPVTPAAK